MNNYYALVLPQHNQQVRSRNLHSWLVSNKGKQQTGDCLSSKLTGMC